MHHNQITKVLRSLDEWEYDQIVAIACKVPAVNLETKYSQDAYFMLGSYVRKNVTPPAETLARCYPYINMGSVIRQEECDVMYAVIEKLRPTSKNEWLTALKSDAAI